MNLELVDVSDPILRTPAEKFNFAQPQVDPVELYNSMAEFLIKKGGIGLAAPQVGLNLRMFVMRSDPIMPVFNPLIVDRSIETTDMEEACLSVPGLMFNVKRPHRVRVRCADALGQVQTHLFQGMSARVVAHEFDHLEGILFTNYIPRLQLEMALKKLKKQGGKSYQFGWLRNW